MSYLNDNNLDDLFKRASDKYPLRTDSADWERMAADLDKEPSLILPPAKEGDNSKRRRFLWLFLLLPLAGIGYFVFQHGNNSGIHAGASVTDSASIRADRKGLNGTGLSEHTNSNNAGITGGSPATSERRNAISGKNTATSGSITTTSGRSAGVSGSNVGTSGTNPGLSGVNAETPERNHSSVAGSNTVTLVNPVTLTNPEVAANTRNIPRDAEGSRVSLKTVPTSGGISLNLPAPARNKNIQATDTTKPKTKKQKDRQASMYIGVIAAPDLSTVKFQNIKGTGMTAGILLGYNINRKLALETGIYLDRKKYYSDGEYFNPKGIPNYGGGNLNNVDGSCNMFEIPINLRYNLGEGKRMKWFATGGLSTYLMTRESYNYELSYGTWTTENFTAYSKPSQNWFSIINLSIGFEQKLGKVGQLRVEPYWRIPTSGMGQGRLPIMSAGLNIGITHKLW